MLSRVRALSPEMVDDVDGSCADLVARLVALALDGLPQMYLPASQQFVQTVRGMAGRPGPRVVGEGTNLRYAAIVALGLHQTADEVQRRVLSGSTAAELSGSVARRARTSTDPGVVALAAWAASETENRYDAYLFDQLGQFLDTGDPLPTVDVGWMLTAAVAASFLGDTTHVSDVARARLLASQGPGGLFPHALPAQSLGRLRAHVGCFADQVYPIQALARYAAAHADADALAAANRCAARICELQGDAGQWWWHYDSRGDSVVEGFPVYSVHQHAMAPMALLDLFDAGGDDHRESVWSGVGWLSSHPEVLDELVDERFGVVWRKVGRREPAKAVRKLNAVTTSLRPGLIAPGVSRVFPASVVDHECRPYELGWLLYAWCRAGASTDGTTGAEVPR